MGSTIQLIKTEVLAPERTHVPPKAPRSGKHIPELDGLRGLAILMVIAFHYSVVFANLQGPLRHLRTMFVPGWTGVDLFFALSGFLITGILVDAKGTERYFQRFYTRRIRRIFPVYYLALFVCFTVARGALIGALPEPGVILAYVFHLSNWLSFGAREIPALSHFWSLAVEEQFYLCWPLAVYWLSRKSLARLSVTLVVLAPLLRYYLLITPPAAEGARLAYALTPARVDTLAIGALMALAVRNEYIRGKLARYAPRVTGALVALLFAWFAAKTRLHLDRPAGVALLSSVLAAAYGLIVFSAAMSSGNGGIFAALLRWRVLQAAGRLSYGAYVYHFPLLVATVGLLTRVAPAWKPAAAVAYFCGGFAVTFLLAAVSWNMLEKRILLAREIPTERAN